MITELHINGLRGVQDGGIDELGPLVVLVGPNGCGKSTVLDALLIGGGNNPGDAIGRCVLRRPYSWNGSRWLFHRMREDRTATIAVKRLDARTGNEEERTTQLQWLPVAIPELANALQRYKCPAPYTSIVANVDFGSGKAQMQTGLAADNRYKYHASGGDPIRGWEMRLIDSPQGTNQPLSDVFTQALESGRRDSANKALKEVLGERFLEVSLGMDSGVGVVYVSYDDGSIPVSAAGEGVASLVRIALELVGRPRGTVLLEEPEAHQHPRIIWQTAEIIWATVQRDVQVILSTHSMELLDALIAKAPEGALGKMAVYRLKLVDDELQSARIGGEDAAMMRADFEDDLR